ncbi:hypothetical protein BJY16_007658 [Actinoplanes octamycinicus]|uniref:Uncharacterized protein n=1 Tax=Actinoplanes octamycinicus TaxID=135948 RepID=A0A7W7MBK0_9ACTN|nr:hypothetical protein [Actinoplanes octamycinicus]MBB4744199.1 hypothetical protein [Actinoplanes octamycinicus]GIE56842.1 hypothetical protein Aoc01nite_22440 [Actinoplanes octamycinicus]
MAIVDLIRVPAGDAVTFRLRRSRLWLRMVLIFVPMFLLVRLTTIGLSLDAWDFPGTVIWVLLTAIGGATGTVLGAGRNLGWIRASAVGLEFAATRREPVFLPWSAVQSVALRFTGPLTELLVTPTNLNAATVAAVSAWSPRVRRRSGAAAFIVDVGLMRPGPSALLAELNRRLVAHR